MPELPEVEVTRRRLEPELVGRKIVDVIVRAPKLRLPIPAELATLLPGRTIRAIARRGKYLLFDCEAGWLVIHLGMTGFLKVLAATVPPTKHDHFELALDNDTLLRLHDPRKFGTVLWTEGDPLQHPLLAEIGPEPLSGAFSGAYLYDASRSRTVAVKLLIMTMGIVAGVGNIYANEALFRAGIRPDRPAKSLTQAECDRLAAIIREVLEESITAGSTYKVAEETVAYHPLRFDVYGRGSEGCTRCGGALEELRLGNRSTVFCPRCQS